MSDEREQRLKEIRERHSQQPPSSATVTEWRDVDYLLSLLDRREAEEMGKTTDDDLAYHVVEEMGLGLTFRSCACGQLPCAQLQPLRDALATVRQEERRAAFRDAIAAVPPVGVTFTEGYEEWIDAPSYRENVIAALEAAAEHKEEGKQP